MKEYPKIQSVFKRETEGPHKGKFIEGKWALPEFEYLRDCEWEGTEKIDGTNIRVQWTCFGTGQPEPFVNFQGKTDNAQIPPFLLDKLKEMFPKEKLQSVFPDTDVCLYGEGYGARIQKGGGNYIPDGVSFVLFDVWIGGWWLLRPSVVDIAMKLHITFVPLVCTLPLLEAITMVRDSTLLSGWSRPGEKLAFPMEGLVLKPPVELFSRNGHRIITKVKTKDFYKGGKDGGK